MAIRQEGNTYYGLSTDTKPTGAVLNGREFKEMDTGKKYLFDAENGEWLEQPEEGGGGGGGSGGVLALHVNTQTGALDKTWQEIYDQINAGTICVVFQPLSYDGITGLESLMVTSVEDQTQVEWGNGYAVICSGGFSLSAQTPNDYPIIN